MFKQMKWENVYELWKKGSYQFPQILTTPMSAESIFIEYKQDGYIYGYDWLENTKVQKRKQLIEENFIGFMYFTEPTNKGTIQTAEMLVEAQDEEERAAIWIAATAKELSEYMIGNSIGRYADMIYWASCEFLRTRYYLWHHAMKKLVPRILIPYSILENIVCKDADSVIELIQMNTILLKSSWTILQYSSLENGKTPETRYRIND